MAAIVLEQLRKTYPNGVQALRDLTLTVYDGEYLLLLGPSGSGKTTILRLLAGLETPSEGTIRIGDRVVNLLPPRKRDLAMVFQRPALYPFLNVRGNLAFGLRMQRVPRREAAQRIVEAARELELSALLERYPSQLSGGEQQRVALGRALVRRPAALLLDEPLSSLDPPLRSEMRQQLHLLHQRFQTTMIHVTHDQVEAMTLGDRVAVLDAGRVRQVDRPQALYDHPRDRFVAGFIGWPPMNFLPGTVSARENHLVFTQNGCSFPLPSRTLSGANGTDREAILGIRPEALRLQPAAPGAAWRIVRVEPLGGTCLVTLEKAGQSLVAQTEPGREWQTGQTVDVSWNMAQTHLFDRSTGMALATG